MDLKKFKPEDSFIGEAMQKYQLADLIDFECFIEVIVRIQMITTNLHAMVTAAVVGQKEVYIEIKNTIERQVQEFINAHDEVVEENFKEKKESMN
jgi:hypothetical protein